MRRRRAVDLADDRGLDGLLVWGRGGSFDGFSSVHYFANHVSPMGWLEPIPSLMSGCEHAALLIRAGGHGTLLVTEFIDPEAVIDECRSGWDLSRVLAETLVENGLGNARLGLVGGELLPHAVAAYVQAQLPGVQFVASDDISWRLRRQLSPAEVELVRAAGQTGSRIYEALTDAAKPGATEGDMVAAGLSAAARTPGCAHWTFLVSSGPRAGALVTDTLPAWRSGHRYQEQEVVHPDCIGFFRGYCYDLARTFVVVGEPSRAQQAVIDGARTVTETMASVLTPGATPREIHGAGQRALKELNLVAASTHGGAGQPLIGEQDPTAFGHAIGAGIFPPYITPFGADADEPLSPPTAMALEVFAMDAAGNVAFHEDNYLVLEEGLVKLTDPQEFPRQ